MITARALSFPSLRVCVQHPRCCPSTYSGNERAIFQRVRTMNGRPVLLLLWATGHGSLSFFVAFVDVWRHPRDIGFFLGQGDTYLVTLQNRNIDLDSFYWNLLRWFRFRECSNKRVYAFNWYILIYISIYVAFNLRLFKLKNTQMHEN